MVDELYLNITDPNDCKWTFTNARHEVNLGPFPETSTASALERAKLVRAITAVRELAQQASPASSHRALTTIRRFITLGISHGLFKSDHPVQWDDVMDQLYPGIKTRFELVRAREEPERVMKPFGFNDSDSGKLSDHTFNELKKLEFVWKVGQLEKKRHSDPL